MSHMHIIVKYKNCFNFIEIESLEFVYSYLYTKNMASFDMSFETYLSSTNTKIVRCELLGGFSVFFLLCLTFL